MKVRGKGALRPSPSVTRNETAATSQLRRNTSYAGAMRLAYPAV